MHMWPNAVNMHTGARTVARKATRCDVFDSPTPLEPWLGKAYTHSCSTHVCAPARSLACTPACPHACTHAHTHTRMHGIYMPSTHRSPRVHACAYVRTVRIRAHIRAHIHARIHAHTYPCMHPRAHPHTHASTHTHLRMHLRTHRFMRRSLVRAPSTQHCSNSTRPHSCATSQSCVAVRWQRRVHQVLECRTCRCGAGRVCTVPYRAGPHAQAVPSRVTLCI